MVKCYVLTIVFILISCTLACEVYEPLLPETNIESIVQDWWREWITPDSTVAWQVQSSYNCSDIGELHDYNLYNHLGYTSSGLRISFNDKRYMESDYNHFYSSFVPRRKVLDELVIGNYRLSFGKSLVMGIGGQAPVTKTEIRQPGSPDRYSLSGTTAKIKCGKFMLIPFLSTQDRRVSMTDSLITGLPKQKSESNPIVNERVFGIISSYRDSRHQLGLMYYRQIYSQAWDTSEHKPISELTSIVYGLQESHHRMSVETAFNHQSILFSSSWQVLTPMFENQLSFVYYPSIYPLPYAPNPLLLSTVAKSYEYSYGLQYKPLKALTCSINVSVLKKLDAMANPDWLGISVLGIAYKQPAYQSILQLYRYDREIITTDDSTYAETVPMHYRVRYRYTRRIDPSLAFNMLTTYTFEQKQDYDRNSYYWENSFSYSRKHAVYKLGLSNWQTTNRIIETESNSGATEEYMRLVKDDLVVFTHARVTIKRVQLYLGVKKSLVGSGKESFTAGFSL
ncbi:MAG: hypothetical protein CVU48_04900 [Candidatus Cloacimonetes bacterium HGW-Cloacimonetes-1]|jgi:hypothetical protein|nr:MAG: hypothetical protein CVU48_04900 [Candidatus Cloacimonetes bacterium HGW-Cloacimonetes-1]